MQTTLISTIISHAVALPTHVLMPSMVCRKLWTLMGCDRSARGIDSAKHHPGRAPERCFAV
jgi:hypothetical protein